MKTQISFSKPKIQSSFTEHATTKQISEIISNRNNQSDYPCKLNKHFSAVNVDDVENAGSVVQYEINSIYSSDSSSESFKSSTLALEEFAGNNQKENNINAFPKKLEFATEKRRGSLNCRNSSTASLTRHCSNTQHSNTTHIRQAANSKGKPSNFNRRYSVSTQPVKSLIETSSLNQRISTNRRHSLMNPSISQNCNSANFDSTLSPYDKKLKRIVSTVFGSDKKNAKTTTKALLESFGSDTKTLWSLESFPQSTKKKNTSVLTKEKGEKAKKHWKLAIRSIMKLQRATKIFHLDRIQLKKHTITTTNIPETIMRLRAVQSVHDAMLSSKVEVYLSKDPYKRNNADMMELINLLTAKLSCFSKYTLTQRLALAFQMKYLSIEAGRVILKEGNDPTTGYYIILAGQVEVTRNLNDSTTLRLNILNKGDAFGEIALQGVLSKTRTATVTTLTQTELLMIPKDEYLSLLEGEDNALDVKIRNDILKTFKPFHNVKISEPTHQQLVMKSTIVIYEPGTKIIQQGALNEMLNFIISGSVSLRKSIFMKCSAETKKSIRNKNSTKECDKMAVIEIAKLGVGQSFPELLIREWLGNTELSNFTDDSVLFEHVKNVLGKKGCSYPAYSEAVAESFVRVLRISRQDLIK
ncbi:hypothetical protein HK099_003222 [Clydaea vesicula]|uniref:Cyclic nucleotide-binding domain-containing protein n=1 Tax=Clydaea vesicula TaxID=447962 RepID=A0AAD5XWF7_9FUNG|nr:hypothetical protein HK099_003222 [Clydaea vesicula]